MPPLKLANTSTADEIQSVKTIQPELFSFTLVQMTSMLPSQKQSRSGEKSSPPKQKSRVQGGMDFSLILLATWLDCTPPWNLENNRSRIASPTPRTGCEDAAAYIFY